ncbi:MAG: YetF domain-containing protein [Bdellovibrionota bacterium]
MWSTETPVIELLIRASAIFFFAMIIMRVWGKKHLSELNPFDLVLMLIMSESLQNALVDDDKSIAGGMISMGTLVLLNVVLNKLIFHSRKAEKIIEGTPRIIIKGGEIDQRMLKHESMTMQDLHAALRQQGVMEASDVEWGIIEPNGKFSVIKKQEKAS